MNILVIMVEFRKIGLFILALLAVMALSACGQIDDDLSDCLPPEPPEPEKELELDYELKLVTNMTTELQTQLNTITDVEISDALKADLSSVFRDFAHDVDLSFYDTQLDSVRLHHESHIMDDNQSSYTLNLPMREYMHLASANIANNSTVSLLDDEHCHKAHFFQIESDTINSHETGLFTARAYMKVLGDVNQTFNVRLYMANAASSLVVDTTGVRYKSFRAYARGFAIDFQMSDSAYVFAENSPYVRARELPVSSELHQVGFCTVSFPSRNPDGWWMREKSDSTPNSATVGKNSRKTAITRAEGEIIPEGESSGEPLWEYVAFVTLEDGKVTKTTLTIKEPLLAGELKIINARMDTKGEVIPTDVSVGCSVTLDWTPGVNIETEL